MNHPSHSTACLAWIQLTKRGFLSFHGQSMRPLFRPGDRLCFSPVAHPPQVGDLALVEFHDTLYLHRVIAVSVRNSVIQTRGDAMLAPDPPIEPEHLVGLFTGLYDPARRGPRRLPFGRAAWNRLMRFLVRMGDSRIHPARVLGLWYRLIKPGIRRVFPARTPTS